jgi:hypothetical protein
MKLVRAGVLKDGDTATPKIVHKFKRPSISSDHEKSSSANLINSYRAVQR